MNQDTNLGFASSVLLASIWNLYSFILTEILQLYSESASDTLHNKQGGIYLNKVTLYSEK